MRRGRSRRAVRVSPASLRGTWPARRVVPRRPRAARGRRGTTLRAGHVPRRDAGDTRTARRDLPRRISPKAAGRIHAHAPRPCGALHRETPAPVGDRADAAGRTGPQVSLVLARGALRAQRHGRPGCRQPLPRPTRAGGAMTNLINTLYVTTPGAYLRKDHESLVVRIERRTALAVPIHHLAGVVCFGQVGVSHGLLHACGKAGVAVSFLSRTGRFLARVEGPRSASTALRRAQFRAAEIGRAS